VIRLVGAVLAEQHDEWAKQRRSLGLEVLSRTRAVLTTQQIQPDVEEVSTDLVAGAINAKPNDRPPSGRSLRISSHLRHERLTNPQY